MSRRVAVTGIGVISPVGTGKEKFWASLTGGVSGIGPVTAFDCGALRVKIGGVVKDFDSGRYLDARQRGAWGRAAQYAYAAAQMALADAKMDLKTLAAGPVAVCMGSTMGESQAVEAINEVICSGGVENVSAEMYTKAQPVGITAFSATELGLSGPQHLFLNACASGNYALGHAAALIRNSRVDRALAGGVDVFSKTALIGFNRLLSLTPDRCRPFDRDRKGLVVSEGAGVLLLEELETASSRGASIYAEVKGYGLGTDAYHITTPHPEGAGAAASMTAALQDAGTDAAAIDYICAHGTGTPANDKTESRAIRAVFKDTGRLPPTSSIKAMLGHTMGAAGALEAAACCLMLQRQIILPTINFTTLDPECIPDCVPNEARPARLTRVMSNAFAFGGNNSCLILGEI
jgi:3-oxoacyl-[acyl-carrier-protein] synthase II